MTLRRVRGLWRTWSPSTAMAPCLRAAAAGAEPMTRRTPLHTSSSTECFPTAAGYAPSPLSHHLALRHRLAPPHGRVLSHHRMLSHHPALARHAARSPHRARSHRPAKPSRPARFPRQAPSPRRARCHRNASSARQAGPRPATRGPPAGAGGCPTSRRPPAVAGHAGAATRANSSRAPRIGTARHPPPPAWPRRRCSHRGFRTRPCIRPGLPPRLSSRPRHPRRTRRPAPAAGQLSHP